MPLELEWNVPEATDTPVPAPSFAATMADRLLMFIRNTTGRAIVGVFAARIEAFRTLAASIPGAFDLATATGVHLDRLGAILQRPRYGETDDRYRALLQIQVQLILASQATTAPLLEVVRLFTGVVSPEYMEAHPAFVGIGAVSDDPTETAQLVALLRKAKAGGVALVVYEQDEDALQLDYHPGDPLADAGTLDYHPGDPLAGAGTLSYQVPV